MPTDKALPNVQQTIKLPNPKEVEIQQQQQTAEQMTQPVDIQKNDDGSADITFDPGVANPGQTQEHFANLADLLPDDADLDFQVRDQSVFPRYKNLDTGKIKPGMGDKSISDTNFLKNYANKKKSTMKEIVETGKKKKEIKHLKETPHEDPRIPEFDDSAMDELYDEFGNYIGD